MRAFLIAMVCLVASTADAVQLLKQSTAKTEKVRLVDSIDGVTPEEGLSITQADIRISKNGGVFAQSNNSAGGTHDSNGFYSIPLDATDTNTLGTLKLEITKAGAAPFERDFMVVPANVYDSLVAGSDELTVDGAAVATDLLATVRVGSPTAGTYGELFDWLMNSFASDGVFAAAALAEAPTGSGSGLTAQQTRDAMKLAPTAGAAAAGSIDALIGTPNVSLADDINAIDGGDSQFTADRVAKRLTFQLGSEATTASNIVSINTFSSGTRTLGYDLREYLRESDTTLSTVSSVTVVNNSTSASITTGNLRKHQNGVVIMWDTAAISTAGDYTVTVTFTTLDTNTVVVKGTLRVQ